MKLVKPTDHKFAALHGASGPAVHLSMYQRVFSVEIPPQSYFRLNAPGAGRLNIHRSSWIKVQICISLRDVQLKYNVANLHAGCGAFCRQKCKTSLFHHRELVQEHV